MARWLVALSLCALLAPARASLGGGGRGLLEDHTAEEMRQALRITEEFYGAEQSAECRALWRSPDPEFLAAYTACGNALFANATVGAGASITACPAACTSYTEAESRCDAEAAALAYARKKRWALTVSNGTPLAARDAAYIERAAAAAGAAGRGGAPYDFAAAVASDPGRVVVGFAADGDLLLDYLQQCALCSPLLPQFCAGAPAAAPASAAGAARGGALAAALAAAAAALAL